MSETLPGGLSAGISEHPDARPGTLSHVDEKGAVRMVDVSEKDDRRLPRGGFSCTKTPST